MKNLTLLLILTAVIIFHPNAASAIEDKEAVKLIENYVTSLQSKDPVQIQAAWSALNAEPDAVAYMKINYYNQYFSFKLKGIEFRLDDLEKEYSGGFTSSFTPTQVSTGSDSVGSGRTSNSEIADRFPNQDRPSNQEMLRRRKD